MIPNFDAIANEIILKTKQHYRVLLVPDLHFRIDSTVHNYYFNEILSYLDTLKDICDSYNVDVIIFEGDVFDDGFNQRYSAQYLNQIEFKLSKLQCLLISLMGNHELHNALKGCPWFSITNIINDCVLRELSSIGYRYEVSYPVMYCCSSLLVNCVRFILYSYSDIDTSYLNYQCCINDNCNNTVKGNIGVFHDYIISSDKKGVYKELAKYVMHDSNRNYHNLMNNFAYAEIGHIHLSIGEFNIGNCKCYISGSIGRTSSLERHNKVLLSLYDIYNDSYSKSFVLFPLLPYKQSFNLDEVRKTKTKSINRMQIQQLSNTFHRVTYDAYNDINSMSNIDDNIKNVCLKALKGQSALDDLTKELQ